MAPIQFNNLELPTQSSLLTAPGAPFIHRDLSWLQFNDRVLAEAMTPSNPLLERAKFLAISASNMDEFFTIRFASLHRSVLAAQRSGVGSERFSQLQSIRTSILADVAELKNKQTRLLLEVARALDDNGVEISIGRPRGRVIAPLAREIFEEKIVPFLGSPTPYRTRDFGTLKNLQMAAVFRENLWLPLAKHLPQAFCAPLPRSRGSKFAIFFLDDLLLAFLPEHFNLEGEPAIARVTRDGDFSLDFGDEDQDSIPDVVRSGIGKRDRGRAVRLQINGFPPENFVRRVTHFLKLDAGQVFLGTTATLCLSGLWSATNQIPDKIAKKRRMRYDPLKALIPHPLEKPKEAFEVLKKQDILLHHPYDTFAGFVGWIEAACTDPKVTNIDLTVYRTDALSPITAALKEAGRKKKIRVVIEPRARFDELNNLRLAEELRGAGVKVYFGFGSLKVHAKIALVRRKEGPGAPILYTHLSTGNYNAVTARLYTDLAILTADRNIGQDALKFFDTVAQGKVPLDFKTLVSAPTRMHRRLLSHIEAETKAAREGKPARIVAKVNALVDEEIIKSLYRASCAGVRVDLIVRGACSLIPGIPGLSKNIRVISIIDRFLEHSRLYYFKNADSIYLSSADWMPRNFFSRLEVAFPLLDPRISDFVKNVVIPTFLSDNVKARELTSRGVWKLMTPASGRPPIRSQFYFEALARSKYKGTPIY
jgi:polyphosphate kinase